MFLENSDSLLHVLKIIKTFRILKPESKIFLFTDLRHEDLIFYFNLLWRTLKAVDSYIITDLNLYGFDPLNNTIKSINCVENGPLQDSLHLQQYPVEAMVCPDNEPYATNDGDGICSRILTAFKTALNLRMNITFAKKEDDPYTYGIGNEFGGQYRLMDQQKIDIVCGSQPMVAFPMGCCEILPGFISDEIVWTLPKAQKIDAWKTLLLGFEVSVWICVIGSWLLSSVIFWIRDRRGFLEVAFNVFGCLLGSTALNRFKQFAWLFLLYAIVITSCYKSKLVGLMAIPQYEKPFESLANAAEAGLIPLLYISALEPFKVRYSLAPSPSVRALTQPGRYKFYSSIVEGVEEIFQKRQSMALMSKYQAEMVIMSNFLDSNGNPLVAILSDTPLNLHMYASPANPLLRVFQRHVLYLDEAGLTNFWVKEMKLSAKLKFVYNKIVNHSSGESAPLNDLSGVFFIYILGLIVAWCCFLLECVVDKIKNSLVVCLFI